MAKKNVHVIRGVAHWAKILGDPVPNYGGDGREWTIDLTPDADGLALLKELGVDKRLKNKDDERKDFIQFRQKEKRLDGSFNKPINVTDSRENPWPRDRLIGNGTVVDLKFEFKDYGVGKQPGLYPQAVRVLEYKEYKPKDFAPLSEDDPFYEPAQDGFEGRLPDGMEPELNDPVPEEFAREFPE